MFLTGETVPEEASAFTIEFPYANPEDNKENRSIENNDYPDNVLCVPNVVNKPYSNVDKITKRIKHKTDLDKNNIMDNFSPLKNTKISKYSSHLLTNEEVKELKETIGVRDPNKNYNKLIDGHGTGLAPPTETEWQSMIGNIRVIESTYTLDLPSYLDHSKSTYFPAVGDQEQQGSCAAWATTYYIAGYLQAKDNYWTGASKGYSFQTMSPAWTYNKVNGGEDSGSTAWTNHYILKTLGGSTLYNVPYDDNDYISWGSESAWREAPLYRIGNISQTDAENIDVIKSWLNDGYVCYMGINSNMYNSGLGTGDDTITTIELTSTISNHANTIVGYDDNKNVSSEKGAFKVVNSWGSSWGSKWGGNGFYWITYQAFINLQSSVYMFYDRIDYEPSLLATLNFSGDCSKDTPIDIGYKNSTDSKIFKDMGWTSGIYNYPKFMCFDITEFADNIGLTEFFIDVDDGTNKTSVSSFKLEFYKYFYSEYGYFSQRSGESPDIPKYTPCVVTNSFDGFYIEMDEIDNNKFYRENVTLKGNASNYIEKIILYEDFESEFPNDWIVGDSEELEGYDYWGNTIYRSSSGFRSAWCAQIQEPLYEQDFDNFGFLPTDWDTYSSGNHSHPWTMNNTGYGNLYGGPNYGAVCDSDKAGPGKNLNEWLYMTKSFNASNVSSLCLEFYLEYKAFFSIDEYGKILYSYDSQYPTFYTLKTWTTDTKGKQQLDLSVVAGKNRVYLAFVYNATYDYHMFIDNIRVLSGIRTNNHTNKMNAYMVKPVNLTEYDMVYLNYDYWLKSENNYDYLYVIYYANYTWFYVDDETGNSYGWSWSLVNIPTNASYVGFFYESDTYVVDEGAYIDNVELIGSIFIDHIELKISNKSWNIANGTSFWNFIFNTTNFSDGENNISIRAKYNDQYSYDFEKIKIDNTPPNIFTPSSNPSAWSVETQPVIFFSTTDLTSGMDHYELNIDGSLFYNVKSPYILPSLSDGIHLIIVRAYDNARNYRDSSTNVYIDTIAPNPFTPVANQNTWTTNNQPTITFSTSDTTSSIDHYDVKVDNGAFSTKNSPYKLPILNDGIHTVIVKAYDKAGNYATGTVNVYIDCSDPNPLSLSVYPDNWASNKQPIITFSSSDSTSNIDCYKLKIDNGDFSNQLSPYKLPPLCDGIHIITVRACDMADNFVENTISIYIDTQPPDDFEPTAVPSKWSSNNEPEISFSTQDLTSGIDHYEIKIDLGTFSTQASPYKLPSLDDGEHIITVKAFDKAGNYKEKKVNVYIDTTTPNSFTPTSDSNGWTNNNQPTIHYNTTDQTSGIDYYKLKINDGKYFIQNSPFRLPPLQDGKYTITIQAYDKAGNFVQGDLEIYIDSMKPTLVINSPIQNSWINNNDVFVDWDVNDTGSGIKKVELFLDGLSTIEKIDVNFHEFKSLDEGKHEILLKVYDYAENIIEKKIFFKIDITEPEVNIILPVENIKTRETYIKIIWLGTDILSGINYFELKLNDDFTVNLESQSSYIIKNMKDGNNEINIKAVDIAGNFVKDSVDILVDTERPEITKFSFSQPELNEKNELFNLNCSWSTSDSGVGINYYLIKIDNKDFKNFTSGSSYDFGNITEGLHAFMLRVYDKVGNYNELSVSFVLETQDFTDQESESDDKAIQELGIIIGIILVTIIILIILIFLYFKKKKPQERASPKYQRKSLRVLEPEIVEQPIIEPKRKIKQPKGKESIDRKKLSPRTKKYTKKVQENIDIDELNFDDDV